LHQQHQQLQAKQHSLSQRIEQHHQQDATIAKHASADSLRPALAEYDQQLGEQAQQQAALQAARSQLASLQQQYQNLGETAAPNDTLGLSLATQQQVIETLQQQIAASKSALPQAIEANTAYQQQQETLNASLTETRDWLAQHTADATLLTDFPDVAQLRNLRSELAELSAKQKSQSKSSKQTRDARQKNQSLIKTLETRIATLQQQQQADQLALTQLADGRTLPQLQALLEDQQQRVADFEALNALALTNARLSKKSFLGWFVGNQSVELPDEAALQQQVETLQQRYSDEENISNTLAMAISQEALIKKMTKERAQLVDGKPCFLCGSLHHPYITKPPLLNDSKKALADQKGRLQALKLQLDAASKQLQAAQKTISQQSAKSKFLQQKRSEWAFLANRLNSIQSGLSIDNLALQKSLLAQESDELQRLQKLVSSHQQLQASISAASQERDAKQQLLDGVRVSAEQLDSTWAERSPEWLAVEQQLKHCQQTEKALSDTLSAQLARFNEKLPSKNKENALFDRLNTRRQDYQIRQLREQGVQTELNNVQQQLQQQQATVIALQQDLQQQMEQLRDAENIGLHLAIQTTQQQISAYESQLNALAQSIAAAEQHLTNACTALGIANIAELKQQLRLLDQAPQRQQQLEQLIAEQATVDDSLAALEAQLATIADAAELLASQETLLMQQRTLQQQRESADQESRRLQQQLDKQQHYQQRYQAISTELTVQQQALNEASAQYQLTQGEPSQLRGTIHALLVDQLLASANRILEAINGRYFLRSQLSSHGLALEVEDSHQQRVRRHPKTLSGGESFVVSLSLALALAELSKNGRAIESLFLDEGFGNLDAESLYLALTALESLPLQGKTVGIISHVDGVKKRIKTQIELVKKANGLSELRLVA
jgi:exonuclease SbcC